MILCDVSKTFATVQLHENRNTSTYWWNFVSCAACGGVQTDSIPKLRPCRKGIGVGGLLAIQRIMKDTLSRPVISLGILFVLL